MHLDNFISQFQASNLQSVLAMFCKIGVHGKISEFTLEFKFCDP